MNKYENANLNTDTKYPPNYLLLRTNTGNVKDTDISPCHQTHAPVSAMHGYTG